MFVAVELSEIVTDSENIIVYNDGETIIYGPQDLAYSKVVDGWKVLLENAREMPAFGVSLNNEALEARKSGIWVEFVFGRQYSHNEMTFEKLLFKVERDWKGFNVVRYNAQNGYSGRCYFFDLAGQDMSQFYDILINL